MCISLTYTSTSRTDHASYSPVSSSRSAMPAQLKIAALAAPSAYKALAPAHKDHATQPVAVYSRRAAAAATVRRAPATRPVSSASAAARQAQRLSAMCARAQSRLPVRAASSASAASRVLHAASESASARAASGRRMDAACARRLSWR